MYEFDKCFQMSFDDKSDSTTFLLEFEKLLIQISRCFFTAGMICAQQYISRKRKQMYVACVKYCSGGKFDIQLCVTGSCHLDETTDAAAKRELEEELGITLKKHKKLKRICKESFSDCDKTCETFIAKASNMTEYKPSQFVMRSVTGVTPYDDKKRKIQCVVYGPLSKMEKLFNKVKTRSDNSEKDICGVTIVKFDDWIRALGTKYISAYV